MATDLKTELRQTKPFASLQQEAYLSLIRTGSVLTDGVEEALKPHGVTSTQYNVLRILRGSEPAGLCRNDLRDRLLTRMPDVTRLLDRMEDAGLVQRERSAEDRRLVTTRITRVGIDLLEDVDGAIAEEHNRALGHMSEKRLRELVELLKEARAGRGHATSCEG